MENEKSKSRAKNRRKEIEIYLSQRKGDQWKYFSPVIYTHWKQVFNELAPKYLHGNIIDVGCGNAPYLNELKKYSDQIVLMDWNPQQIPITLRGDVRAIPLTNGSFDSVICLQVFEHVDDPFLAIKEINRITVLGGIVLFSVPHLSRLHELPNDYYRYTENGIKKILNVGGFDIIDQRVTGGLITFLLHQLSLSFLISLWGIKILRPVILAINKYLITISGTWIDRNSGKNTLFPQGYVIVAKKNELV